MSFYCLLDASKIINEHLLDGPDVTHTMRLQRKQKTSPRSEMNRRSSSAHERLFSLSSRKYVDKLDLQLSRTKSVLEFELNSWFGTNAEDIANNVYAKYLAVNPLLQSDSEYEDDDDEGEKATKPATQEGQLLEKLNELQTALTQMLEIHEMFDDAKSTMEGLKDCVSGGKPSRISKTEEQLLSMRNKILPYKGRESSRESFNEIYHDFLNKLDRCDCAFVKNGKEIEEATVMEVAMHAHHRLNAMKKVEEQFISFIRETPEELKDCPIEMQILYQSMVRSVYDGSRIEQKINAKREVLKSFFESSGIEIGEKSLTETMELFTSLIQSALDEIKSKINV